jgi:hypothetical protein
MRGEKDSAALMVHVTDCVDNEPAAICVELGGWFVKDEDWRRMDDCACDTDHL